MSDNGTRYNQSGLQIDLNLSQPLNNLFIYLSPYGRGLGGIGNKLFLIAVSLGIANKNNYTVLLDNDAKTLVPWFPNVVENLTLGIPNATYWKTLDYLKHWDEGYFQPELLHNISPRENFVNFGSPASYLYFNDILPEINRRFQLDTTLTRKMKNFLDTNPSFGGPSCVKIGVHVRLGNKTHKW